MLTERLIELAEKHGYVFDPEDFNFVAIRDRIRCYYKSYVQTARKRGLLLPADKAKAERERKATLRARKREEIERLKEGDILETTFAQFADQQKDLYLPLIDERDRYMAARLRQEIGSGSHRRVLAVVGAGHLRGIASYLHAPSQQTPEQITGDLDQVPRPSRWPRSCCSPGRP